MDDKVACKQQSSDKIVETPQMKAIREKMLQKLTARDKSSVSPSKTSVKSTENRTIFSLKRTSKVAKNDESISLDKNDNEITPKISVFTTFTPQMSVLYGKIQQRNLNKSNPDKKLKINAKNKQQNLNITSQVLMKTQENQRKNTRQEIVNQKNNVERYQNNKTQNAQKSHSQNISSN